MSPQELGERVAALEAAIRKHRDAQGQDLCWENDLELWAVLDDGVVPDRKVPPWPEFMAGCVRYRQMLDRGEGHRGPQDEALPIRDKDPDVTAVAGRDARPCDAHTLPLFLSALFDLVHSATPEHAPHLEQVREVRIPEQHREHAMRGVFGPDGTSRLWGASVVWEPREDFQALGYRGTTRSARWGELDIVRVEEAEARRLSPGSGEPDEA